MSDTLEKLVSQGLKAMHEDLDQAELYFWEALELATLTENVFYLAKSYIQLSRVHSMKGQYEEAVMAAQKGLSLSESANLHDTLFAAYYSLGNIYAQLGELERGLDYYQKGLKVCEAFNFVHVENFLNNMAVIYSRLNLLEQSLATLLNAFELSLKTPKSLTGFIAANIAEVYLKLNLPDQAIIYCQKSESLLDQYERVSHYDIQLYKVLGILHRSRGAYDQSIEYLNKGIELAKNIRSSYRQASLISELSKTYIEQGQLSLGVLGLIEAYEINRQIEAKVEQRDIAKVISDIYQRLADYKEAYHYLMIYHELDSKIRTKRLEDALMIQTVEFELAQANKNTEMLQKSLADVHFISEIGRIITSSLDMDDVLHQINEQLKRITGLNTAGIFLYLESNDTFEIKLYTEGGLDMRHIFTEDSMIYYHAMACLHEKNTLFIEETELENKRSSVYFPLIFMAKPIGVMMLKSSGDRIIGDREIEMAMALGSYIAIALNNSQQSDALRIKTTAMENLARIDDLTGLYNRRYTLELMKIEHERFVRNGNPFVLAIMDLDYFKQINDTYGHQAGDYVIKSVSAIMKDCIRPYDVLTRWGGEEFILLLPETQLSDALNVCKRINDKISLSQLLYDGTSIDVSITIGLAESNPLLSLDMLIKRADEALYRGKKAGRNCVVI